MARKEHKPKVDADGSVHTGIYVKRPRKNLLPVLLSDNDDEARRLVEQLNAPPADRLAEIRSWLAKIILEHVDGPLSDPLSKQERPKLVGRMFFTADLGGGVKCYVVKTELDEQDQWVIDRFHDARDALYQILVIEHNLEPSVNLGFLFRATFQLGKLCERIQVRPWEELVATERGRRRPRPGTGAKLPLGDWNKHVRKFIAARVKLGNSAADACKTASAQLRTGTLPGLNGTVVDISASRLQNLWSNRNK